MKWVLIAIAVAILGVGAYSLVVQKDLCPTVPFVSSDSSVGAEGEKTAAGVRGSYLDDADRIVEERDNSKGSRP